MKILTITDLTVFYKLKHKNIPVVKNFNFSINEGEIIALTGKSGSGKTSIAKSIMKLHKNYTGNICLNISSDDVQYIFQDPYSSLNPFTNISYIISEGLKFKHKDELDAKVIEVLNLVGLDPSKRFCYASDFSGGERQKIAIARALIRNPKLIIADEISASIDYYSKISIINLIKKLQKEMNFSCILISHDKDFINKVTNKIVSLDEKEYNS